MKINYQNVAEREPNKGFSRCYKLSHMYMYNYDDFVSTEERYETKSTATS